MQDFETRLGRLEGLADTIRRPDLPIEEAMAVFEEGIGLARGLERDLAAMQGKVELLLSPPEEEGELRMTPYRVDQRSDSGSFPG